VCVQDASVDDELIGPAVRVIVYLLTGQLDMIGSILQRGCCLPRDCDTTHDSSHCGSLQSVTKNIRVLKTRLQHLLIDQQDLEEVSVEMWVGVGGGVGVSCV